MEAVNTLEEKRGEDKKIDEILDAVPNLIQKRLKIKRKLMEKNITSKKKEISILEGSMISCDGLKSRNEAKKVFI